MEAPTPPTGVEVDAGRLCVFDASATPDVRRASEALVQQLFTLPCIRDVNAATGSAGVRVVKLPPPHTRLPRQKPLPTPREPTRWEIFAKEKGIQKRPKRSRLVWDEQRKEYLPRYGRSSAKSLQDVPVLPHREDLQPGENPFTKAKRERRERVQKNKARERRNVERVAGAEGLAAAAAPRRRRAGKVVQPLRSADASDKGASGRRRLPLPQLRASAKLAQLSTASVGKFDRRVAGEGEAKVAGKRTKKKPVAPSREDLSAERAAMAKLADRVFKPRPAPMEGRAPAEDGLSATEKRGAKQRRADAILEKKSRKRAKR